MPDKSPAISVGDFLYKLILRHGSMDMLISDKVLFAHRNTIHAFTGLTPSHEVLYGRKAKLTWICSHRKTKLK